MGINRDDYFSSTANAKHGYAEKSASLKVYIGSKNALFYVLRHFKVRKLRNHRKV